MNHKTVEPEASLEVAAREQHYGDLRKGAYLKRRAEYQMQAHAPSSPQAGTLPPASTPPQAKRRTG